MIRTPADSSQRTSDRTGPIGSLHALRTSCAARTGVVDSEEMLGTWFSASRGMRDAMYAACIRRMFSLASTRRQSPGLAVRCLRMWAWAATAPTARKLCAKNSGVTPKASAIRTSVSGSGSRRSFSYREKAA